MTQKSFCVLALCLLFVTLSAPYAISEEFRVRGGKADDFEDPDGRIWFGAQKNNEAWGGWVELLPRTAEVATLTADARQKAEDAGYAEELFYAVSWAQFPETIKYQLNTGNGFFDVTYLVGEHWSPNNRGYDIFIEDKNVLPLYVTPGMNEIDIQKFEAVEVKDEVMDFHFAGNPDTGKGDLNAMFSALEVVPSARAVKPADKLAITWGKLKLHHQAQ